MSDKQWICVGVCRCMGRVVAQVAAKPEDAQPPKCIRCGSVPLSDCRTHSLFIEPVNASVLEWEIASGLGPSSAEPAEKRE